MQAPSSFASLVQSFPDEFLNARQKIDAYIAGISEEGTGEKLRGWLEKQLLEAPLHYDTFNDCLYAVTVVVSTQT